MDMFSLKVSCYFSEPMQIQILLLTDTPDDPPLVADSELYLPLS